MFKKSVMSLLCLSLLVPIVAFAETTIHAVKPLTPQQERMKTCNADAKGKKGEEHKVFMKSCLKGETAVPAAKAPETKMKTAEEEKAKAPEKKLNSQQMRMKTCNVEAKGKKGTERKSFMKSCLSNK
ncbi:PsiF family protein [Acidithiobacillus sp. M4-SHS-6]|uniref:PsiF family protein n=1 Tax=Acidithiobacillus sp. M4-SHS-6 TaxID=3383024 RepID=UPI0039BDF717